MTSTTDKLEKTQVCKNCNSVHINNYCSDCGQKIYTKRFTLKNFFFVFLDAFNIEKGFLYTLRMLFTQPGKVINDYISGKTKSYFNPLKYVLIIAGIFAFLVVSTGIIDTSIKTTNEVVYNSSEVMKQQQEMMQNDEEALQLQKKWIMYKLDTTTVCQL